MNRSPMLRRWTAAFLCLALSLAWGVLPVLGQDMGDAATQQYMQERLAALRTQQQKLSQELQSVQQTDPARAEYLGRLITENQALEQRYVARIQGQPIDGGQPLPAEPQGGSSGPADPSGNSDQKGGVGGMLKNLMGGGETNTTDIIISIVSGLGGWYLGKMAFGPIGGIV
ncbi:MAG: hypothetical protein HY303_09195, partial [Candidatus Wallbacteria bacterium]|nr:hypothetical protein [Candidatus Wallbacteria bacterium]